MDIQTKQKVLELVEVLSDKNPKAYEVVIGFDGFVDEILHVVAQRKNADSYTRMSSIREYGEKIVAAAGLSTNIEMVQVKEKLGGNGPILGHALGTYGAKVTCIGSLGYPNIHPVFEPMRQHCHLISISEPGLTDALEFDDGKIIVGKHQSLKNIHWDNILNFVGKERLVDLLKSSKLIGFENWTMLPHMSGIWKGLLKEVMPDVGVHNHEKYVFFDLCDPEKRTQEDILEALDLIRKFTRYFKVILGLNFREAILIAKVLGFQGYDPNASKDVDLEKLVKLLAQTLEIYSVVVHPTTEAATVIGGVYCHVKGPYTPKPKLTTGAGDNFNAGFCLGQILDLEPQQSILLGVATSGFYVRNAKSPTLEEVISFLKDWSQDGLPV
jgi:hypothetical protein